MAIVYDCPECGRKVTAPDELAGKKARCPFCQSVVAVPGAEVLEAEAISQPRPEPAVPRWPEPEREPERRETYQPEGDDDAGARRPCPMCGEMILQSAIKCRFCGEVFGAGAYSGGGGTRRRSRNPHLETSYNAAMTIAGVVWIFFGGLIFVALLALSGAARGLGGALSEMLLILGIIGGLWLLFGICACCKQIWAAWAGLVFSYLSVLGNLISLGNMGGAPGGGGAYMCGVVFALGVMVLAIVQAHRAISMYGELSRSRHHY